MSNLRWKVLTVLVVFVVFAAVGVYPILSGRYGLPAPAALKAKALKLGLDLQGGVHLVLKVQTDDALKFESEREMERLREELQSQNINPTEFKLLDPARCTIVGLPSDNDAEFRSALVETEVNFERTAGTGGSYTFNLKPSVQASLREEAVTQARQTIERRVNE